MPGDKKDMSEFIDKAISTTKLHIDFTLPQVFILLPDKDFLELLYNRLLNDLVLWEPTAPAPLDTLEPHSFIPGPTWSTQLVAQLMHQRHTATTDTFMACKSTVQYDSSSESEDGDTTNFYTLTDTRCHHRCTAVHGQDNVDHCLPSKLCVTLNIGKGRLLCCLPKQCDQKVAPHGRLLLDIEDGSVASVIGYNGDPDLQFLCVQLHKAQLHHRGFVEHSMVPSSVDYLLNDERCYGDVDRTVYLSEEGVCSRLSGKVGRGPDTEDMVSIAVRVNTDTLNSVKKYTLALGIRGATLRHRMVDSSHIWLKQMLEFFNVADFDIPGYSIPKVVMELHTHLWSCAIDYRPKYLNYRALVTMETFSISSNVIVDSPVSLLRFILDDGALYLSDKVKAQC
jgi:autophagy-related protein 2